MSDDRNETHAPQDSQKTIVAFIVGLLIGGLIVWMFSGTPSEAPDEVPADETAEESENGENVHDDARENGEDSTANDMSATNTETPSTPVMEVGDGSVVVNDQAAGSRVALEAVTFPMSDGWIGVRDFTNQNLGSLLGVMRFSEAEGLIPQEIILQAPTTAGNTYAIVFYTASETNQFNLGVNSQIEGVFATFTAQ